LNSHCNVICIGSTWTSFVGVDRGVGAIFVVGRARHLGTVDRVTVGVIVMTLSFDYTVRVILKVNLNPNQKKLFLVSATSNPKNEPLPVATLAGLGNQ